MALPEKFRGPLPARWFARLVLILSGVVWLGVGALGLFSTEWLADIVDLRLDGASALAEFRAVYGGLFCSIATLHFVAAIRAKWLVQALTASIALDIGLVAGRGFSIALAGAPGPLGLGLLIGELLLIGVCSVALWRIGMQARADKLLAKSAAAADAAAASTPDTTHPDTTDA